MSVTVGAASDTPSVKIAVRLFAQQRQLVGWKTRELELEDGATIAAAWDELVRLWPVLGPGGESVRFARNAAYAGTAEPLRDGDELAVIPPVAGGATTPLRILELQEAPFGEEMLAQLRARLATPADGAVVLFVGQTRETPGTPAPGEEAMAARFADEEVRELEYEAFTEMALRVFDQIADEIAERFSVERLAIVHRTGEVPLGEASVVVAAAAPHRGPAFDAARYAIDELKGRAPIWKSERFATGSVWIGSPARSGPATP
jgi:molybdopterin synthase catalytic subunit/molybdopterin converting factor small subunit